MIDKDWLEDAIKSQAENHFDRHWNDMNFDEPTRMAFMALRNTSEWKQFRKSFIENEKKKITDNVLNQLQGIKNLLNEGEN